MATATFTTVEARVDQILSNAIWADEIKDNLNQMAGSHRNLLVNGGFEVWQRGASFSVSPSNTAFTADRWLAVSAGGTTSTITQETSIVDTGSASSLKYVTSGGTATCFQKLEDYSQLRGQTISLSMRVRQGSASAVTLNIEQTSGVTTGSASATTGSFVTLTVTATIASNTNLVQIYATIASGATVYFDNAMLVIGPAPAPYRPLHPQEELARCQRYYEIVGGVANSLYLGGYNTAGGVSGVFVPFKVAKGGTPTVTKNGTWNVNNCAQPTIDAPAPDGCRMFTTITATGTFFFTPNTSDDTISADWAP